MFPHRPETSLRAALDVVTHRADRTVDGFSGHYIGRDLFQSTQRVAFVTHGSTLFTNGMLFSGLKTTSHLSFATKKRYVKLARKSG